MTGTTTRLTTAVLGAILISFSPADASAQWSATSIGVAEYDTEQTLLLLGGISAGPGGMGWKPRIGFQGYYLRYDVGSTSTNVLVGKPYVGVRNAFSGGSVGVNVGYAFSDKDASFTTGAFVPDAGGDGVVLSGGWDQWGTGGPMGYQVLGAYNFGTEGFWGRGRVTRRLGAASSTGRQRRFGGEVAYLAGDGYSGVQPGAIMEFHDGNGRIFGLGAGMKFFDGGGDAVYFKGEFVLPIGR